MSDGGATPGDPGPFTARLQVNVHGSRTPGSKAGEPRIKGTDIVIDCVGVIDDATRDLLTGVLRMALTGAGSSRVVIDLSATTGIDEEGLQALHTAWLLSRSASTAFGLRRPPPAVRNQLTAAGLDNLIVS